MKLFQIALAVAATAFSTVALAADVAVTVTVTVGQPGFYGRIELGDVPKPVVIYREPKVVERVAQGRLSRSLRASDKYDGWSGRPVAIDQRLN